MDTRKYVLTLVGLAVVLALLGWVLFSDTDAPREYDSESMGVAVVDVASRG